MKIKGLIFDLDGVIVSTEINHFDAWSAIAEQLSIEFNEADNEKIKGLSRSDSLDVICDLGSIQLTYYEKLEYLELKNKMYLDSIQSLNTDDLLPGVLHLLKQAKKKDLKLALGSSSKNAKYILQKLFITDYFDVIIDGNDVESPKPDPEVFLKGAEGMGLNVEDIVVFEDAESGILAAQTGGFYTVAVGNRKLKNCADECIDHLGEFLLKNYE